MARSTLQSPPEGWRKLERNAHSRLRQASSARPWPAACARSSRALCGAPQHPARPPSLSISSERFLVCGETYPPQVLRAGSTVGRHSRPTRAADPGLGLRGCNQSLPDCRLALSFARPAHGFRLLAGFALGGLLVGFARLHLAE